MGVLASRRSPAWNWGLDKECPQRHVGHARSGVGVQVARRAAPYWGGVPTRIGTRRRPVPGTGSRRGRIRQSRRSGTGASGFVRHRVGAARSRLVGGAPASVTKLWEVEEVEVLLSQLLR